MNILWPVKFGVKQSTETKLREMSAAGCCSAFLDLDTDSFDHIIKIYPEQIGQIVELTELRAEHAKVGSNAAGARRPRPAAPVVRTLAKALNILEAVSDTGRLSVAEIANTVGLNRTTTHRLVQALTQAGNLQLAENGYTANTIADPEALIAELAEVRRRGYATDNQEHIDNGWCVAAPISDADRRPTAAVGVSGGDRGKIFGMADKVELTAEIVSHILSPRPA